MRPVLLGLGLSSLALASDGSYVASSAGEVLNTYGVVSADIASGDSSFSVSDISSLADGSGVFASASVIAVAVIIGSAAEAKFHPACLNDWVVELVNERRRALLAVGEDEEQVEAAVLHGIGAAPIDADIILAPAV